MWSDFDVDRVTTTTTTATRRALSELTCVFDGGLNHLGLHGFLLICGFSCGECETIAASCTDFHFESPFLPQLVRAILSERKSI